MFSQVHYMTPQDSRVGIHYRPLFLILSLISALFLSTVGVLSAPSLAKNIVASADNAEDGVFNFLCGQSIGAGMAPGARGSRLANIPFPEKKSGRVYTLEQLAGGKITQVTYYGEDFKKGIFVRSTNPDRIPDGKEKVYDDSSKPEGVPAISALTEPDVLARLSEARTASNCSIKPFLTLVGSGFIHTSNLVTSIVSWFATSAFNSKLICEDPAKPEGVCINLLKIIGGDGRGSSGGIIGALTSNIYLPLAGFAFLFVAVNLVYKGIVKGQVREAIGNAVWAFAAFVLGVIFLFKPHIAARAPMVVSNSVASCVIGAFTGTGCSGGTKIDTEEEKGGETVKNVCKTSVNGLAADEQTSVIVGSLGCQIWKAFVLEPFANMQFGMPYEELETRGDSEIAKHLSNTKNLPPPEAFCFNKGTDSGSDDGLPAKVLNSSAEGSEICNIAAYQMFLRTNASSDGTHKSSFNTEDPKKIKYVDGDYDARWYNIISVMATSDTYWQAWGASSFGLSTLGASIMALVASIAGGIVLIVASLFALVFYFSSTILMAFAPLFLLFGIHPGQGKRIALGWGEQVLSNVMKYIASAFFLIVAITLYGGVLGNASNMAMAFIYALVLTFALWMYRRELIDLIGTVNMGGQQISNRISNVASRVGKGGLSVAGSAVGAKLGGDSLRSGMKDGLARELKKGSGFTAETARQYDRNKQENRRSSHEILSSQREDLRRAGEEQRDLQRNKQSIERRLHDEQNELTNDTDRVAAIEMKMQNEMNLSNEAIQKIESLQMSTRAKKPKQLMVELAGALKVENEIKNLERLNAMAQGRNDFSSNARLQNDVAARNARLNQLRNDPLAGESERVLNELRNIGFDKAANYAENALKIDAKDAFTDRDLQAHIAAENSIMDRTDNIARLKNEKDQVDAQIGQLSSEITEKRERLENYQNEFGKLDLDRGLTTREVVTAIEKSEGVHEKTNVKAAKAENRAQVKTEKAEYYSAQADYNAEKARSGSQSSQTQQKRQEKQDKKDKYTQTRSERREKVQNAKSSTRQKREKLNQTYTAGNDNAWGKFNSRRDR